MEFEGCTLQGGQNDNRADNLPDVDCSLKDFQQAKEAPRIGIEFDSDESAYTFYKNYAHQLGFSVRKQNVKKLKDGLVKKRIFCCSKQGERREDKRREQVKFHHPITRVGCLAKMTCQLQNNGLFKVVDFHEAHNHPIVATPVKHMLRSNRKITPTQKALAATAEKSGISIKSTIDLLSMQHGGREGLGFLEADYKNYIHSKRKTAMKKGDGHALMEYFNKMQLKGPSYFYAIQLDDDDRILNIFWADARSMVDYAHFGDVICFDTTYRTNEYGRPFAPFIGVNHHKQSVIFGAALLYEETIESFSWLFNTFLSAMASKQPKTILTDQSAAMASAIEQVFPETNHRLCVWHIYQNAAKHLGHVFNSARSFRSDFGSCVYDHEDENEWHAAWEKMLKKYNLENNKWLQAIFEEREKWAMVYGRHMFTADMISTQRSESMNNALRKYLKPNYDLMRFFEHYTRLVSQRRHDELLLEFKMSQKKPVLLADVEMLRHAVDVYTPVIFKMFQEEYIKAWNYIISKVSKSENVTEYRVQYSERSRSHLVRYVASGTIVQCSCMKFSFVGILCAHAIKVLDKKNIKRIPAHYILKRWTKDSKVGALTSQSGNEPQIHLEELVGKRYAKLSHIFREISTLAAEDEDMHLHAYNIATKLLVELQDKKKKLRIEGFATEYMDPSNTIGSSIADTNKISTSKTSQPIGNIKTKQTVGRPRKRIKSALERNNKSRSSSTKMQEFSQSEGLHEDQVIHLLNINTGNQFEQLTNYAPTEYASSSQPQEKMSFTQLLQATIYGVDDSYSQVNSSFEASQSSYIEH